MGRSLNATNVSHIDSGHTHPVLMGKFEFDTPVYAHTGLGTINWGGNDYLGVGDLSGFSGTEESETIVPNAVRVQLNGLDAGLLADSLDSTTYGSRVTLYVGYRNDDGSLIADPWIFYKGLLENSNLVRGSENSINLVVQHVLAVLKRSVGRKYTDEEQQKEYPGDTAFNKVQQMETVAKDLLWGRRDGRGGIPIDDLPIGPGRDGVRRQIP